MTAKALPSLHSVFLPQQSTVDAMLTSVAALADRAVMQTVARVVQRRILPDEVNLDMLRGSVQAMLASGLVDTPREFFDVTALDDEGQGGVRSQVRRRLHRGRVFDRYLQRTYIEHHALQQIGDNFEDPIALQHWVHEQEEPRATIVMLHGFAMGWPGIDAYALSAKEWYRQGVDVVLLTLPDHGPRRPSGSVVSGQNFTVPHAMSLAAAVRRAVFEICAVLAWLRQRSSQPVGLMGMSLGGYLSSLVASLYDNLDFVVPVVAPACMGDLAWRVYTETGLHKSGADPVLTESNMRLAFCLHSPLAHTLKMPPERALIVAGAGDRIVPPQHPSALWQHWGRPELLWLRGNHLSAVHSQRLVQGVSRHLQQLAIL